MIDYSPRFSAEQRVFSSLPSVFLHACRKYPGQVLRLGNAYVVSDPEHVQEVLIDKAEHFGKGGGMWKALKPLLGEGLITAEGESWRKQRRLMQPLFTRSAIGEHVPNLRALVESECERILQGPDVIDIAAEMRSLSQKILLHTIFGTSQMKATAALHTALSALNLRLFLYFLPNSWIPKEREFMQAISEIDQTIAELDTSLLADSGLSPKELRDQLVTLYVAGSDTVASSLTWLWCALAQFPEMRYVDEYSLFQEVLRLWPPIWFFPRFALEHTQIGNRSIPAGSMVILCPLATHRDPRFWEQPDQFNPCNRTQKHRLAFYPFGAGVRKCLGEHFGFTEMQTVFSVFSKRLRFDLTASTDLHLSSATTLWPKRGLLKVRAWNP